MFSSEEDSRDPPQPLNYGRARKVRILNSVKPEWTQIKFEDGDSDVSVGGPDDIVPDKRKRSNSPPRHHCIFFKSAEPVDDLMNRRHHNELERGRRHELKLLFNRLRGLLGLHATASTVNVLIEAEKEVHEATQYLRKLKDQHAQLEADRNKLFERLGRPPTTEEVTIKKRKIHILY